MNKFIPITFLSGFVLGIFFSYSQVGLADETKDSSGVISVRLIKNGSSETALSFSGDDLNEVSVEKGLTEYRVKVVLDRSRWGIWEKFTEENYLSKFAVFLNGRIMNGGVFLRTIKDGSILMKRFQAGQKKDAEDFARQIIEQVGN